MRVKCTSLDDFITNLESDYMPELFRNQVFVDITQVAIAHVGNQPNAWDIYFHASALVEFADETGFLLECGVRTGIVNTARNGTTEGMTAALELRERLVQYCASRNWKVCPGSLDVS
jgi:hypothetical protein